MRLREFYDHHLALLEGGIALVINIIGLSALITYSNNNLSKDVVRETYVPLVNVDSVSLNIDINNFLFSSFNSNYTIYRYFYDQNSDTFIADSSFKVNNNNYKNNTEYLNVELISSGYDENKDFFIKNALNEYAYISCEEGDEIYLESSLNELKDDFNSKYLFNKEEPFSKAFNSSHKYIVAYYSKEDLCSSFELINYLSIYANRYDDVALVDLSQCDEELFKTYQTVNANYVKNEKVVLFTFEGNKIISTINQSEAGELLNSLINKNR